MSKCERIWEVEAARDGKIAGEDLTRVERHIAGCADCEQEREGLAALARQLQAIDVPGADELRIRRWRHELLSRANSERLNSARPAVRKMALAAAFLLTLLAGGWVWYSEARLRATPAPPSPARDRSNLIVKADPGANFDRETRAGRDVIDLRAGRVTLIVNGKGGEDGVLVRTPDGTIQDVGTSFAVRVREGRTDAIEVFEGRVFALIAGRELRVVGPGDVYEPYTVVRPIGTASPKPRGGPANQGPRIPMRRPVGSAPELETQTPAPNPPAAMQSPDEFAEAFAAFEAGEMSRAAALFFQYEARHRDEIRAEDAAFLRIVALTRAGRAAEASFTARAYLRRYPSGFRARDVQHLLPSLDAGRDLRQ